jgi:small nuclear ribonucleoprotein F
MEYQGKLESSDAYMNLQLLKTEEYIDGTLAGYLGEVLIRCNNVLYVKAAEDQNNDAEEAKEDSNSNMQEG